MKVKSTKGMRDIATTTQGLASRSLPSAREQAVTEMARLEHEKARLERELRLWSQNQQRVEGRLRKVEERLALLQQVLEPPGADGSKARRSTTEKADDGEDEAHPWREIPLGY